MKPHKYFFATATLALIGIHAYVWIGLPGTTFLLESGLGRGIGWAAMGLWVVGCVLRFWDEVDGDDADGIEAE